MKIKSIIDSLSLKQLRIILACFAAAVCVVLFMLIIGRPKDELAANAKTQEYLLSDVSTAQVGIDSFYIYGNHLHLGGSMSLAGHDGFRRMGLVLRNSDGSESEIALSCKQSADSVSFVTSEYINLGIGLDELTPGDYCVLFKVVGEDGTSYVSAKNLTNYDNTEYYTVTRQRKNHRILIGFEEYYNSKEYIPCLALKVKKAALPDDVYDIVIDAGHGGQDCGALGFGYQEADITIDYALALKDSLEKLGLKVFLTRNGTEGNTISSYSVYDADGRVNTACASRAKYCFSIHLNSSEDENITVGGVQVYCANHCDTGFAKKIADGLVQKTGSYYSDHAFCQLMPGVYMRTFTQANIDEAHKFAKELGYEPYPLQTTDSTYYYIIRETGGIATNAYVDGRNPEYGTNLYRRENRGIESYLLELGFICVEKDLINILNNREAYIEALTAAISEELGL